MTQKYYIVPKQETSTMTYWNEECKNCGHIQELKQEMKSTIEFNDRNYKNEKVIELDHTNAKLVETNNVCKKCGTKFGHENEWEMGGLFTF